MPPVTIDCEIPSPHISGISWRPGNCNNSTSIILVLEALIQYVCDNISPSLDGLNNNLRIVPGGTDSSDFNAEFYLSTPADEAMVVEGANFWFSESNGASWDLIPISAFQIGNTGDFSDPDNPTAIEFRALFPQQSPAQESLVYYTYNNTFYRSQNSGGSWSVIDFVQLTGDTMSGTLNVVISEIDPLTDTLGINIDVTNDGDAFGSFLYGLNINTNMNAGAGLAKSFGINIQNNVQSDVASDPGDAYGINVNSTRLGGTGTSTNMIAYHAEAITNSSAGDITNAYGLKIESQTDATNNYAIHTGIGLNHFGDQVKMVGNQDIEQLYVIADNAQTFPIVQVEKSTGAALFYLLPDGEINILGATTVGDGGGSTLYLSTPTRSAMTTTVEQHGIHFDISSTRQWTAGAIVNQREVMFERPTYSFTSASTITNAATVYIKNAPSAGTNATITNAYALWIDGGNVRVDDKVAVGITSPTGKLHVQQESTTGAIPVITLQQKDTSEEMIRFVGEAQNATTSLVDGDTYSQFGAIKAWVKVYVQDDANQIPDGYYYMPIYDTPTEP